MTPNFKDKLQENNIILMTLLALKKAPHVNLNMSHSLPLSQIDPSPQYSNDPIQDLLQNLGDGFINPSAYDTAWLGMLTSQPGGGFPLYPECLYWLIRHQLHDGSWGELQIFHIYDRLICTLAAVIALQQWNLNLAAVEGGCDFINRHIHDLPGKYLPTVGFELIFPRLMEIAYERGLPIPIQAPALTTIRSIRAEKLRRIPHDIFYTRPTTLLHSLEGARVDPQRVLSQISENGSFLNSPASTAYVYQHTRDARCRDYLDHIVTTFGGCAPVNYPLDIFETLWVIDQITRMGRASHYLPEIHRHLERVHRVLTPAGMPWSRCVPIPDLDDTAVAFRLFKQFGYPVTDTIFDSFYEGRTFYCFPGELNTSPSHLINLFITVNMYAHESAILTEARHFIHETLASQAGQDNLSQDKWVIRDTLQADIVDALNGGEMIFRLPSIELWVDKCLYRMDAISHPVLARASSISSSELAATMPPPDTSLVDWV